MRRLLLAAFGVGQHAFQTVYDDMGRDIFTAGARFLCCCQAPLNEVMLVLAPRYAVAYGFSRHWALPYLTQLNDLIFVTIDRLLIKQ
ncbi:hypothetical protein ACLB1G_10450 [Oxalobacteraceae bacterium A2-2]